jgi:hypothetical protein
VVPRGRARTKAETASRVCAPFGERTNRDALLWIAGHCLVCRTALRQSFRRLQWANGGLSVPETQDRANNLIGPFLYFWLALSMLLNIAGVASIVDGLVHWAGFFRDALDNYRASIREPLSWAVHLVWPSWWPKIPAWVFDLLVVWSTFFLAINLANLQAYGVSYVRYALDVNGAFVGILVVVRQFLTMPVRAPFRIVRGLLAPSTSATGRAKIRLRNAHLYMTYFLLLVGAVIVLAFLNWQFQHIAQ